MYEIRNEPQAAQPPRPLHCIWCNLALKGKPWHDCHACGKPLCDYVCEEWHHEKQCSQFANNERGPAEQPAPPPRLMCRDCATVQRLEVYDCLGKRFCPRCNMPDVNVYVTNPNFQFALSQPSAPLCNKPVGAGSLVTCCRLKPGHEGECDAKWPDPIWAQPSAPPQAAVTLGIPKVPNVAPGKPSAEDIRRLASDSVRCGESEYGTRERAAEPSVEARQEPHDADNPDKEFHDMMDAAKKEAFTRGLEAAAQLVCSICKNFGDAPQLNPESRFYEHSKQMGRCDASVIWQALSKEQPNG
jgi:hypothetical protein